MAIAYEPGGGAYDTATGMPVFQNEITGEWRTIGSESDPGRIVDTNTSGPSLPDSSYIVRGNYRMPKAPFGAPGASGPLEINVNGVWQPVTAATAPAGYDPRQDSNTQGSNERLRFDKAFGTAPEGVPITGLQQWAMANGWTEPDRSNNEGTLGAMFSNIAPYAGLMLGGIGAMGGFGGLLGGANAGALAAGDSMAGLIPAGELGAWTGAGTAGAAGGSAMDWSNLGDLWDYGGGSSSGWDFGPLSDSFMSGGIDPVSGMNLTQSMAPSGWDFGPLSDALMNGGTDPVSGMNLSQMQPGLLDTIKSYITSNPGSTVQTAIKALSGSNGGSLLGTALGGLLGSINGAKQAGTTTTTQEPWAGQQPYLLDAFERARTAANGSPIQGQANANYSSVLSGPTKNPMLGLDNPYLTKAIDNANSDVTRAMMPAITQANRASGSFGNSGVADVYGKNLTDAYSRNATGMRMTDFTNQQNLQQKAVDNTLGFTTNANNYVAQPSQNYAQTVQGSYGNSKTEPYYNNPALGALGGMQIGSQLGYGIGQTKIGSNLGF